MVNVKDMTPEQAFAYIEKQQEKARDRQRAYSRKQKESGRRRVSVYITNEAARILDDEVERNGKKSADVISNALIMMSKRSEKNVASRPPAALGTPVSSGPSPHPDYDEAAVIDRITELAAQALNGQEIADKLGQEGYVTRTGLNKWSKTVIHRWLGKLGLKKKRTLSANG